MKSSRRLGVVLLVMALGLVMLSQVCAVPCWESEMPCQVDVACEWAGTVCVGTQSIVDLTSRQCIRTYAVAPEECGLLLRFR